MMRIRATVKHSPLLPRARLFRYDKARHSLATGMTRHWKTLMRSGTMANGEPLPVSDRTGLPLGIGNGTIIEGWKAVDDGAISISAPFQEGRYLYAVDALVKRGVVYFSLLGASANKVKGLLVDVEKMLAATLEGGQ